MNFELDEDILLFKKNIKDFISKEVDPQSQIIEENDAIPDDCLSSPVKWACSE
ncbi:hypothetical protein [Sinobaca sp. H24]|uniref:hypothetical protein n=1 Tax=Sinobaca sp. H24 TaxID=2923376 RepID=UPI0035B0624D